jgi:hypothetical protein
VTKSENFRIHVYGNILELTNPKNVWAEHFKKIEVIIYLLLEYIICIKYHINLN